MARFAWVYHDPRFKAARVVVITRDMGLCQECLRHGIKRKGAEVHHIIWITDANCRDVYILFDPENMELLCKDCHNKIHNRTSGLENFVEPIEENPPRG